MEFEDRDPKIPDELVAEAAQCQELIEANREAELMFEEVAEMEQEAEESDLGPESEVKIIELYSESDAEEQKIPSDSESQLSQDEQLGSRKEWDRQRPARAVAHSTEMLEPSVIVDKGSRRMEVGTAKTRRKKMVGCKTEERRSREMEWKEVQWRSRRSSGSRSSRQAESQERTTRS